MILPSGPGTPYNDFARAYQEATDDCRGVKTITASMGLSGKAGETKLRGRIDAGFAAPAKARLEGIPPFGKPVFVLVADGDRGTLVLTREDRVLRDAPPDQIVEALAGAALGPDALRTIISGCGFPDGAPTAGATLHGGDGEWISLTLPASTAYLKRLGGAYRLTAAARGPITLYYARNSGGRPAAIEIRVTSAGRLSADIRLQLSDVDVNTTLDPKTFDVDLPDHVVPLTLDELRRAGPMSGGA